MGYYWQKVFNASSIAQMIEYMRLQVVVKKKRMLGKESNISKQDIFNLGSDIVKDRGKVLMKKTKYSYQQPPSLQGMIILKFRL